MLIIAETIFNLLPMKILPFLCNYSDKISVLCTVKTEDKR